MNAKNRPIPGQCRPGGPEPCVLDRIYVRRRVPRDHQGPDPEWRGYDYVMVGDEILVIDPGTHEVVAIIEA